MNKFAIWSFRYKVKVTDANLGKTLSWLWRLFYGPILIFSRRAVVSYWRKYVHEVLVNRLGGLSLPRKSVVRLTDRPDMTLDVYRGRKTTIQPTNQLQTNIDICGTSCVSAL